MRESIMQEIILPDDVKPALEWVNNQILQKVSPARKHAIAQGRFFFRIGCVGERTRGWYDRHRMAFSSSPTWRDPAIARAGRRVSLVRAHVSCRTRVDRLTCRSTRRRR